MMKIIYNVVLKNESETVFSFKNPSISDQLHVTVRGNI